MRQLVVKENMSLEFFQESRLVDPTKEKCLVDFNPPLSQTRYYPLMGRSIPGSYNRYPYSGFVFRVPCSCFSFEFLQFSNFRKKPVKRTGGKCFACFTMF